MWRNESNFVRSGPCRQATTFSFPSTRAGISVRSPSPRILSSVLPTDFTTKSSQRRLGVAARQVAGQVPQCCEFVLLCRHPLSAPRELLLLLSNPSQVAPNSPLRDSDGCVQCCVRCRQRLNTGSFSWQSSFRANSRTRKTAAKKMSNQTEIGKQFVNYFMVTHSIMS